MKKKMNPIYKILFQIFNFTTPTKSRSPSN